MYTENLKIAGFTLIEMLVVAAIISLLSSIIISSVNEARAGARDAQRQSDLNSLRTGLAIYFDRNGSYPSQYTQLENSGVMSRIPEDPANDKRYSFATAGANFSICVAACMEKAANGGGASGTCDDDSISYDANASYINNCSENKEFYVSF